MRTLTAGNTLVYDIVPHGPWEFAVAVFGTRVFAHIGRSVMAAPGGGWLFADHGYRDRAVADTEAPLAAAATVEAVHAALHPEPTWDAKARQMHYPAPPHLVEIPNVPRTDPGVPGALWLSGTTLQVSA